MALALMVLKPSFATTLVLVAVGFEKSHQGPNYGSQIILAESATDVNHSAGKIPVLLAQSVKLLRAQDWVRHGVQAVDDAWPWINIGPD